METVALVTVSKGGMATDVPDSVERYRNRGKRKRCGRRFASESSVDSLC